MRQEEDQQYPTATSAATAAVSTSTTTSSTSTSTTSTGDGSSIMFLGRYYVSSTSDFSLDNLPFGIGSIQQQQEQQQSLYFDGCWSKPRCLTRVGDWVVDLSIVQDVGIFDDIVGLDQNVFSYEKLNAYLEHPSHVWKQVRGRLIEVFTSSPPPTTTTTIAGQEQGCHDENNHVYEHKVRLWSDRVLQDALVHDIRAVQMVLPVHIGDYTDFYSSKEHATNVGTMFRGRDNALQPNWLHLPVGYHGRSSTIFCTGRPIVRPYGQLQKDPTDPSKGSIYGPSQSLDFELEVAFFVGGGVDTSTQTTTTTTIPVGPLSIEEAKERIFGFVLMNDWSARDIQAWEYVPLGPFTSKNFATTISPWIVTTFALESFISPTSAIRQDNPPPLDYLHNPDYSSYDVHLSVAIQSETMVQPHIVCKSNLRNMYWDAAQQLVHHSVTGCIMRPGDLLGSGTISGTTDDSFGSMLELSWRGTKTVDLYHRRNNDGEDDEAAGAAVADNDEEVVAFESRKFLQDGDTVIMTGYCSRPGHGRVGFGECRGKVLPAGTSIVDVVVDVPGAFASAPPPLVPSSVVTDNTNKNTIISRPSTTTSPPRYQDFKLYSFWKSSSTWRVRIALAAKGVEYTTIPINLQLGDNTSDWFLEKNPIGQIPVLEYTDTTSGIVHIRTQSVAIIEFLDYAFPQSRALIPRDPMDRVIAMEMIEVINSGTQPLQNRSTIKMLEEATGNVDVAEQFRIQSIRRGLLAVQRLVERRKRLGSGHANDMGPFAMGGFSPTIVDCYLVPQLYNAEQRGIDIRDEFPILADVNDECSKHRWFISGSHPSAQPDAPK